VLVCEAPRQRRYRFRHALYRSAIRQSLDPQLAHVLHARIAALERSFESRAGAEVLAYHRSAAGNARRARRYRRLAAAEARHLGSPG
jgi:hypothetical protein